jgi:hypothetical protein
MAGIDGLVGDHQRLGGAGEQVDADPAEQLALGLGDKGVAGADQHVDRGDAGSAERHGAHGLDAAQAVDHVGPGQMLGGDDRRGGAALIGRGAGDDLRDARDLGGQHRHVRRRDHRVLAARHVAADPVHRDVLLAQHHARQGLDLEVPERGALVLREAADLRLGEADVVQLALRELAQAGLDLLVGQAEVGAVPLVELDRQFAHRLIAARLDVGQDRLDRAAHRLVVLGRRHRIAALLQHPCHRCLPSPCPKGLGRWRADASGKSGTQDGCCQRVIL